MGSICVLKEYYEPDKDSVEYDIFFKYINNHIMYDCRLFYWICDSDQSEFYRLSMDKNVLTVDNGKWGFGCPNYSKEVSEAFKELIKDIERRFSIIIPLNM